MVNDITFGLDIASLNNESPGLDASNTVLPDEAATLNAGAHFADILVASDVVAGLVIYLHGELGAGKTTFTRGFLHGLGFVGKVKSPTYTLVEPYVFSRYNIYHFDLYRFIDEEEWESSGFREYFNAQSICLIEWPEKAEHLLPLPDIHVHLSHADSQRKIQFLASSTQGKLCLGLA